MKYIMFEVQFGTKSDSIRSVPIIFPDSLVHSIVAEKMMEVFMEHSWRRARVVSAGECNVIIDACGGKSETLNVTSRGEQDQRIINTDDYLHGML